MSASSILIRRTSAEHNQRESLLLRLPAEIRNTIYRLVLDEATIILTWVKDKSWLVRLVRFNAGVHTRRACRQINRESSCFACDFTTICLVSKIDLFSSKNCDGRIALLRQFSSRFSSQVRELCIQGPYPHKDKMWNVWNIMPALQRLVLIYEGVLRFRKKHTTESEIRNHFGKPDLEITHEDQSYSHPEWDMARSRA